MRRARRAGVVVLAVLAGGCGAKQPNGCAAAVVVGGQTMRGFEIQPRQALPPVVGHVRARGVCGGKDQVLDARRGIPASVALFPPESGRAGAHARLYYRPDSLPSIAGHPLHRYAFASRGAPNTVRGRLCRSTTTGGIVKRVSWDTVVLDRATLRVEAATKLRMPRSDGVARLRVGDPVLVQALRCPGRARLVARRIAPA